LKNGETFTETVWVSKGDLEDPYTEEELDRKFIDLTGPIYGLEKAKEILDRAKRVESYKDVRTFTEGF
jgi:tRNA A58 N-methylase Trm61